MTISAKPSVYTVNTGHTHCPNHLWMMDEGTGTTLTDKGKTAGYNLTLTDTAAGSGPEWATDGTHGPVLDFVLANGDHASYSSVSGLTGTHVIGVIVDRALGTTTRCMASVCDPTQLDRFAALVFQGDEDVEAASRFDATQQTATSTQDMAAGWNFVAVQFSDATIEWSLNGSAWSALAVSHSGLLAAVTRISLGALAHSSPQWFWDDFMCAAMWWKASKSDADIASIAADPWQFLDTSALTSQQPQFYRRPNTLLRM